MGDLVVRTLGTLGVSYHALKAPASQPGYSSLTSAAALSVSQSQRTVLIEMMAVAQGSKTPFCRARG